MSQAAGGARSQRENGQLSQLESPCLNTRASRPKLSARCNQRPAALASLGGWARDVGVSVSVRKEGNGEPARARKRGHVYRFIKIPPLARGILFWRFHFFLSFRRTERVDLALPLFLLRFGNMCVCTSGRRTCAQSGGVESLSKK